MWPAARLNCHGKVDLTPVEFLKQPTASVTHERHSDARPRLLEPSQNRWCVGAHDVRGHAQPNLALECRCAQARFTGFIPALGSIPARAGAPIAIPRPPRRAATHGSCYAS